MTFESGFSQEKKENKNTSWLDKIADEIKFSYARSSGPGGQKVNKTSTKVVLRWNLLKSQALTFEEKSKIKKALANILTKEGEIVIFSQETRSQKINKRLTLEKLNNLIESAFKEKKPRIPTKPKKQAKEKRLKEKKIVSQKKKLRKKPDY